MANNEHMARAEQAILKLAGADKKVGPTVKDPNAMARDVLTFDREAVRRSLKESRIRHTVRVKSVLP